MALIIDGSCVKNMIVYGRNFKEQVVQDPNVFAHGFLNYILSVVKKFNQKDVYIALDTKGKFVDKDNNVVTRNYWRQKYYDTKVLLNTEKCDFDYYKCSRAVHKDDGVDWESIEKIYHSLLEILDKYSDICVVEIPYLEADDICAIIVQCDKYKNDENIIVTNDHDLLQLITKTTKIYNPFKQEVVVNGMTEEELTLFFLSGCKGDSVPPIMARTKEKTWIKKLKEKSLEQIFEENIDIPLKQRYEINKKIMSLSIDNIPKKLVDITLGVLSYNKNTYNEMNLKRKLKPYDLQQFVEEGCKSIYDRIKEFKVSDIKPKSSNFNIKERKKERIESLFDSN